MSDIKLCNVATIVHMHSLVYEGRQLPVEIGACSFLQPGVPESERRGMLATVDRPELMTARDRRVNRVGVAKSSTLPVSFVGDCSPREAEARVVAFCGNQLVAVKGLEAKRYLKSLGLPYVVDIQTEMVGDCPPYWQLEKMELPFRHEEHADPWRCSRVAAELYARFLEEKRRQLTLEVPSVGKDCCWMAGDAWVAESSNDGFWD